MKALPLLAAILFGLPAKAQEPLYEEGRTFTGALAGGLNFAQVDGDSYYGYHKVGLHLGAMAYAHFTQVWGASMEMLYSQKGSRGVSVYESPAIGTYIFKYYMDLNYVEVPLMLHTIIMQRYDVEAGVSFAYLLSSKEWIQSDQPVAITEARNYFNNTDLDMNIGLTARLYRRLFANIRYQYSLTSMRPPERIPVGYSWGNLGQFNNLFNLRLVYQLGKTE